MRRRTRRRSSSFSLDDLTSILESGAVAGVAAGADLVMIAAYYFFEPDPGISTVPMSMMPHIFWEAFAVRFFWPGVGLFALGLIGLAVSALRSAKGFD
jgi:hypothetical protein